MKPFIPEIGIGIAAMSGGGSSPPPPVIPATAITTNADAANYLIRTTSVPNKNPLSIRAWVQRIQDPGDHYIGFTSLNKSGDELFYCGTAGDGKTLEFYFGADEITAAGDVSDGLWHHVVYTYDGTIAKIYFDGSLVATQNPIPQAPEAALSITVLNTADGASWTGGIIGLAIWEEVITQAMVTADRAHLTPVHLTNLWGWWLLQDSTDIADRSGHSRDLSLVGSGHGTAPGPGIPL